MQRFRLLRFYVIGVVAAVALAIGGVATRRTAADGIRQQAGQAGTLAPATAHADGDEGPSPSFLGNGDKKSSANRE
jgi:hypothetical protein